MILKNSIDSVLFTGRTYLTHSWKTLTNKVSSLANVVFSKVYAIYDFPRSTNPVTREREFRCLPTLVEKAIGELSYSTLLRQSGMAVEEKDNIFGMYSKLVREVGQNLAKNCPRKDLSFDFKVVENSKDNAWCLPGGKIAINLGLIRNMEKEEDTFGMDRQFTLKEKVAAVLSHEVTHAAARHGGRTIELRCFLFSVFKLMEFAANFFVRRYYNNQIQELEKKETKTELEQAKIDKLHETRNSTSNTIFNLFDFIAYRWILSHFTLCTSKSHELEADKYGMYLIHMMGTDGADGFDKNSAEAAVWLQHYFQKAHPTSSGLIGRIMRVFSTHPPSEERLAANKATWEELRNSA